LLLSDWLFSLKYVAALCARALRGLYPGKAPSLGLALLIFITGCGQLGGSPLPTYAALAVAPEIGQTPSAAIANVPPTYTAVPAALIQAGLSTSQVRPTSSPLATAPPSATPELLAVALPQPDGAPYLEQPPSTTPCEQGTVFRSRFPSEVAGPWREYHAYLPPCYGQDGRVYPVVYLFHGSIQDSSHWLDLGWAAYADAGILAGRFAPFIAIMPFNGNLGNISSGGPKSIEAVTIENLLPFVETNFCTLPGASGRSIGGISRGGYWALEIAFRQPGLFGAVAGHSSHLRFETDPARYNPLATYAEADLSAMRIWLDRGETDFLGTGQDQLHERLLSAGIKHEYHVNLGGHNDAYWLQHMAEYVDWHASLWPRERTAYPICN
jgi:enterochelin esterase-like enzyme